MSYLPSTASLRTFEVAARLLNFTRAAEELNLTQGAVSHQMRELEKVVGVALFER
jgi:LysR family glycine cleavage system transcriptional activator